MRVEQRGNKVRFVEDWYHPITRKRGRVTVTYEKDTPKTRKLAEKELAIKKRDAIQNALMETGVRENDNPYTLKELTDLFLKSKEKTIKRGSLNTYRYSINSILSVFGEQFTLDKAKFLVIENKFLELNKMSKAVFLIVVKWGFKKELIKNNITEKLSSFEKKKKEDESNFYYEKEEIKKILDKFNESIFIEFMTKGLIIFLVNTGVRIGEAMALTWEEIDLDEQEINIIKNITRGILDTPKTDTSIRKITFNKDVKDILLEIKSKKQKLGFQFPNNLVFSYNPSSPNSLFLVNGYLKILKKKNINTRFHKFRHTHASLLAEEEIPLDLIQRRLGHKNDTITRDIYIHVTNKTKEREKNIFLNLTLDTK